MPSSTGLPFSGAGVSGVAARVDGQMDDLCGRHRFFDLRSCLQL
jgi:hypothetical protein